MNIQTLLHEIRHSLLDVFGRVDDWFDQPANVRSYAPKNGGWTINQVLEHISLTSHFLLILIEKGARKARENIPKMDLAAALEEYSFEKEKLDEVGLYQSFEWIRPEHMEPTGEKDLSDIRQTIQEQLFRCLTFLDALPNGEGVLYQTTMTVNNLGKIDVYEYIYFLGKHAERHLTQMERNTQEFRQAFP